MGSVARVAPSQHGLRVTDDGIADAGEVLLEKYRVERVIGEGGMGVIFAVRHVGLGMRFAMKVLKPSALSMSRSAERFAREARALSRLRSPHVARVLEVGRLENELPYMLLEYLEGDDLGTVLSEVGSIEARLAVDYAIEALDAVVEAHQLGIVHRDLKPENLFLAQLPDGRETIKVLDFGISKDLRAEAGGSVTHTSNVMGSPHYMSPEQMRSTKHVDTRTDIWAFGVILYELLSAEVPFPGESVTQVCANVLEHPARPLAELAPDVPASLCAAVAKCLAREPDDRYQSAAALAAALCVIRAEIGEASPNDARRAPPMRRRTTGLSAPVISRASLPGQHGARIDRNAMTRASPTRTWVIALVAVVLTSFGIVMLVTSLAQWSPEGATKARTVTNTPDQAAKRRPQ